MTVFSFLFSFLWILSGRTSYLKLSLELSHVFNSLRLARVLIPCVQTMYSNRTPLASGEYQLIPNHGFRLCMIAGLMDSYSL